MPSISHVNRHLKMNDIYFREALTGWHGIVGKTYYWKLQGAHLAKLSIVNVLL